MTSAWTCPSCASNAGTVPFYPPGPDVYCSGCQRPLDTQERLAAALAELVKRLSGQAPRNNAPTAGVAEAAQILKTTPGGIYAAHARGQMPATIGPGRRLIWRTEDLLECPARRASSSEKGSRRR
jgi:hypothetical protein